MPGEVMLGALSRRMVRAAEIRLDRTPEIGTALSADARAQAAHVGTTFIVSGFGGSVRGLGPIMRSLERDGLSARAVQIPDGGVASIYAGVAELDRAIAAVPTGPIHLAGHSKGGMVVQLWLANATPAQRARVESLTLLASSPTGQRLPAIVKLQSQLLAPFTGPFSRSVAEARHDNPVMARIRGAQLAEQVRGLSIVSEKDELIKLDEARWGGARNLVLRGNDAPNHLGTLVSDDAYDALVANIMPPSP